MRRPPSRRAWLALATLPLAALLFANSFVWSASEFWPAMASGTLVLAMCAALLRGPALYREAGELADVWLGIGTFALLYVVFWLGDKLVRLVLPGTGAEIGAVYALGGQAPLLVIALLLVFVIAPAEELYWRGLVQWAVGERWGDGAGFLASWLMYAGVHVVSGSAVLVLAAAVAGFVWSITYALRRRLLPVVVSHVLFDLFLFVLAPVAAPG